MRTSSHEWMEKNFTFGLVVDSCVFVTSTWKSIYDCVKATVHLICFHLKHRHNMRRRFDSWVGLVTHEILWLKPTHSKCALSRGILHSSHWSSLDRLAPIVMEKQHRPSWANQGQWGVMSGHSVICNGKAAIECTDDCKFFDAIFDYKLNFTINVKRRLLDCQ